MILMYKVPPLPLLGFIDLYLFGFTPKGLIIEQIMECFFLVKICYGVAVGPRIAQLWLMIL